jgi:uncharacterized protein DUF1059
VTPTGYSPGASLIDEASGSRVLPVARFARSAAVPASAPGLGTGDFELRCSDVHPTGCNRKLRAQRPDDLVELAREHGALVHGFTPVWYSKQRLATIAAAIGPTRD